MGNFVQRGPAGSAGMKYAVVIIGGGASGITVAAEMKRHDPGLDIAIVEPSELHWYQPGWTLVGAGVFHRKQTERREEKLIPKGVTWIRAAAASFLPEQNMVRLSDGRQVRYDFLVACPGLKIDWDAIEGLTDTLGRNGVCSNYRPDTAEYTWQLIKSRSPLTEGGRRLWHQGCLQAQSQGDRRSCEDRAVFRDGRGRQGIRRREALRYDPCCAAADRPRCHSRKSARERRRLD